MKKVFVFVVFLSAVAAVVGQPTYEKAESIEGVRAIASAQFNNAYLTMDSKGWSGNSSQGGGKVDSHHYIGTHQLFEIKEIENGIYTISSTFFKNRHLRMDGRGVTPASKVPGGVVNLQDLVGAFERFKIHKNSDGTYSFESVTFPGCYLTLNPNHAAGEVMVQNRSGAHERFRLLQKAN
ncbi:MAG: hypothetical protein AAF587_29305 [Bacteroidota bacterium]